MLTSLNAYTKKVVQTSLVSLCLCFSANSLAKTYPMLYHSVEENETLASLANKFGINIDYIVELNGLTKKPLQVGQKILIPDIGKVELKTVPRKSRKLLNAQNTKSVKMGSLPVTQVTPTLQRTPSGKSVKTKPINFVAKPQIKKPFKKESTVEKAIKNPVLTKVEKNKIVQPKINRKSYVKLNKDGNYDYTVQPNDTVGHIALDFGLKAIDIQDFNDISDDYLLIPGRLLTIPVSGKNPKTKNTVNRRQSGKRSSKSKAVSRNRGRSKAVIVAHHAVQSGDILSSIANIYGVSEAALVEVNNLKNQDLLSIGQIIDIPNKKYIPQSLTVVQSEGLY